MVPRVAVAAQDVSRARFRISSSSSANGGLQLLPASLKEAKPRIYPAGRVRHEALFSLGPLWPLSDPSGLQNPEGSAKKLTLPAKQHTSPTKRINLTAAEVQRGTLAVGAAVG